MIKDWVQRQARRYGYEIRKAPFAKFEAVPVFDLALHYLMRTRGEAQRFIEVGANDGTSSDALQAYIVKYPWTGLLVEPQPDAFARLKVHYAAMSDRLAFENVAVSSNPEPITLYRAPKVDGSTVASSNAKTTAKQLHLREEELERILVPTARLDDLARKHGLEDAAVMQLDTEGFEWEVLQTLDLGRVRPLMIAFEHGHLPPASIGAMTAHLNASGYDVYFGGYESDSVALRKDFLAE
jgi:FkbM family methyltransferase